MHCGTDETQSSSYNFLARPTPHRILTDPETCRGRAPGSVQILFLSLLELLLTSLPGGSGASTPGHVRIETPSLGLGAATPGSRHSGGRARRAASHQTQARCLPHPLPLPARPPNRCAPLRPPGQQGGAEEGRRGGRDSSVNPLRLKYFTLRTLQKRTAPGTSRLGPPGAEGGGRASRSLNLGANPSLQRCDRGHWARWRAV